MCAWAFLISYWFSVMRELRIMQPDPHRSLFVCMSFNILCKDMGNVRGSQSVPEGTLNIGADGSQLLQDVCFLWATPSLPNAKQNGWWAAYHIHLFHSERAVTIHLASQQCLMLFLKTQIKKNVLNLTEKP